MNTTRDEHGFVLCPHGRPMACLECGDEYAADLDGRARGAPVAGDERSPNRTTAESTGISKRIDPDQLQWVLDHNTQIRAGHRVQIADAVTAWREDQASRDQWRHLSGEAAKGLALADRQCDLLRAALVGLVGVDGRAELEQLEAVMRLLPAPAEDKAKTIDAIHALIATVQRRTGSE